MNPQQFMLILRARWHIALTILSAVILVTLAASLLADKQYQAVASVVADVKADPVAGAVFPSQLLSSYIATQVDIINSERVARQVVTLLKLDSDPRSRQQWQHATNGRGDYVAWLAESLQRHLLVAPSRESNIINIGVQWTDPQLAETLANAFAQAYLEVNISLKVDPAKQYADWFKERSAAMRTDLESKRKVLSDFERDKGIVATDERMDDENARLTALSTQLVEIEVQRQASQSHERQKDDINTLPEVLQSPLIASLKTQLSNAEIKRDELGRHLGANHPEYLQAEADVATLRTRVAQETAKIVSSMSTSTGVNVRREQELREALEAQKARVLWLKREHDEAAVMENDVQTAQRNLDAVNQHLAQSSLESLTQQTNVTLLTAATVPFRPSSPKIRLNLEVATFLGILLGVATAVLLELRDRRIRGDDDLPGILGVPLLGNMPNVAPEYFAALPAAGASTPMDLRAT